MIFKNKNKAQQADEALIATYQVEDARTVEATFFDELNGIPSRLTLTRNGGDDAKQTGTFRQLIGGEFCDCPGADEPDYDAEVLRHFFDHCFAAPESVAKFNGFDVAEVILAATDS